MLRVFTDECIMKREYVVCVENMRKNKTIVWKYNLIRIFNPTLKKKKLRGRHCSAAHYAITGTSGSHIKFYHLCSGSSFLIIHPSRQQMRNPEYVSTTPLCGLQLELQDLGFCPAPDVPGVQGANSKWKISFSPIK